jgi:Lsr2
MIFRGNQMQKLEVQLEDDLTGGPADETVMFGVDGREYQIDLNAKHAATFRKQLAAFVERARLVGRHRPRSTARSAASRERSREIRAWAEQQDFEVAEHGRLPAHVIQEYERAHRDTHRAERGRKIASSRTKRRR